MALALMLLLLVIAETVITVWLLARHGEYKRRIYGLEERIHDLETLVSCIDRSTED